MSSRRQSEAELSHKTKKETKSKGRIKKTSSLIIFIKLGQELGLVAQLVERRLCKAEALGPNPSKSI